MHRGLDDLGPTTAKRAAERKPELMGTTGGGHYTGSLGVGAYESTYTGGRSFCLALVMLCCVRNLLEVVCLVELGSIGEA